MTDKAPQILTAKLRLLNIPHHLDATDSFTKSLFEFMAQI